MKVKKCVLLGITAVSILALGAGICSYAAAKEQGALENNEYKGLTISPSIDQLGDLTPGETYTREITAVNHSDKDLTFKVLPSSFWIEGEAYEVKWGVSDSQHTKIADWTDIDPTRVHEVKAGKTYQFAYTISVPKDQSGGAQHLMVTISLDSAAEEGFVNTEMHLNTLIYANIEGEVNPNAEIVSQSIQGFSFAPDIRTVSTVKNTGDVDLDVKYTLYASGFFGGEQTIVAAEEKTLMTESTRTFAQIWTQAPALGIYHVTQEITIMGEVHTYSSVVLICPLWMLILLILSITGMVVYIVYKRNVRKKSASK